MKRIWKILRFLGFILLLCLATIGIGAPISFNSRETYMDYEVKTEQNDKKDETEEKEDEEKT